MHKFFIYLLFSCVFLCQINAQTAAIAHKSHSGSPEKMPFLLEGGFGNPGPTLVKVIKLNKNAVVLVSRGWDEDKMYFDTVQNHPFFCNPLMTLEDFKLSYPNVTFEEFETKTKFKQLKLKSKKKKASGFIENPLDENKGLLWGFLGIMSLCSLAAFAHYQYLKKENNA